MIVSAPSRWVVRPAESLCAPIRLFCFPYAGGGASAYRSWPARLGPAVDVCAIELPGHETRLAEPLYTSFPRLVEAIDGALDNYLDKPFVFFGHSMGALVAFALARRLRARHAPTPVHLMVSGAGAPHLPRTSPPRRSLGDNELLQELQRLDGTPQAVIQNRELMQLLLPIIRADFSLDESLEYTPEPPFDMPMTAFGGWADGDVAPERVAAWSVHSRRFTLRMFQGNHFFIHNTPEFLQTLSADLQNVIRSVHAAPFIARTGGLG
ncbi:MAG TPA: alpha/beta fold hydrolase [Vicinamibacterales bacterium]